MGLRLYVKDHDGNEACFGKLFGYHSYEDLRSAGYLLAIHKMVPDFLDLNTDYAKDNSINLCLDELYYTNGTDDITLSQEQIKRFIKLYIEDMKEFYEYDLTNLDFKVDKYDFDAFYSKSIEFLDKTEGNKTIYWA